MPVEQQNNAGLPSEAVEASRQFRIRGRRLLQAGSFLIAAAPAIYVAIGKISQGMPVTKYDVLFGTTLSLFIGIPLSYLIETGAEFLVQYARSKAIVEANKLQSPPNSGGK